MILKITFKQRIVRREDLFTAYYPVTPDFDTFYINTGGGLSKVKMITDYIVTAPDGDPRIRSHLNYLRNEGTN